MRPIKQEQRCGDSAVLLEEKDDDGTSQKHPHYNIGQPRSQYPTPPIYKKSGSNFPIVPMGCELLVGIAAKE